MSQESTVCPPEPASEMTIIMLHKKVSLVYSVGVIKMALIAVIKIIFICNTIQWISAYCALWAEETNHMDRERISMDCQLCK